MMTTPQTYSKNIQQLATVKIRSMDDMTRAQSVQYGYYLVRPPCCRRHGPPENGTEMAARGELRGAAGPVAVTACAGAAAGRELAIVSSLTCTYFVT